MSDFRLLIESRFNRERGSLTRAAIALGINYSYLSQILNGRVKPPAALVAKLSALPDISGDQLDRKKVAIEFSLTQRIEHIQKVAGMRDYDEAFISIMKCGLTEFEHRYGESNDIIELDPFA